jgi:hypothetical protein
VRREGRHDRIRQAQVTTSILRHRSSGGQCYYYFFNLLLNLEKYSLF